MQTVSASPISVPSFECASVQHLDTRSLMNTTEHTQAGSPRSPTKRTLDGKLIHSEQDGSSCAAIRQPSPSRSTISTLSSLSRSPDPVNLDGAASSKERPAKRRKLTPAEKAIRDKEKAEKMAKREEDKLRREEEKRKKDEERRQKNEILEEKRRQKDLERQEKEQKKQQEEEEKLKKQKAQPRINNFFLKPPTDDKSNNSPKATKTQICTPNRSTHTLKLEDARRESTPTRASQAVSDYHRAFLPFAAPSNAIVAPINHFTWDEDATKISFQNAELWVSQEQSNKPPLLSIKQCLDLSPTEQTRRGCSPIATSTIISRVEGPSSNHIDLTEDFPSEKGVNVRSLLQSIPMKVLYFHEDYRPPYVGTFQKFGTRAEVKKLARRPNVKTREELDYDYDSEAEWEEPEEGEELGSDVDEDEESVEDNEELDGFLDDEEAEDLQRPRKKFLGGDMEPISTGLLWEDQEGRVAEFQGSFSIDPRRPALEVLVGDSQLPIDPFSTSYWHSQLSSSVPVSTSADNNRPPLHPRPNIALNNDPTPSKEIGKPSKPPKQVRLLAGQELEDFKRLVDGSDLTKPRLLAVAKKALPKVTNAVLNDTLSTYAARLGAKGADKRWAVFKKD